jgi:hypothetical protein
MKLKKNIKWLVLLAGLILLIKAFFVLKNKDTQNSPEAQQNEKYYLAIEDSLMAGSKNELRLPNSACYLFVNSSWGCRLLIPDKSGIVPLPDSLLQEAGLQQFSVFCDSKKIATKTIKILPLPPTEPLETYVGSKSIPADGGLHWAMVTSIPADKFQNLSTENTPVKFQFHRPNESREIVEKFTKNGIAYHKIYSQTKVGKTIIGASSLKAIGKEKELLEVPNSPTSFEISANQKYLYADARQFFKLQTDKIKDAFGNTVADGTLVTFKIIDPDNSSRILTGYTLGGVAGAVVQNPSIEGTIAVKAMIYGNVESNKISLLFKKTVLDFDAIYQTEEQNLKIGPLKGALGQYVSDGAEAEVIIQPLGITRKGVVKNGYATVELSDIKSGNYEFKIRFGGIDKKFKLSLRK